MGAALAGYGFATGGLSDLENSTDIVGNVNYQKANLDSFSKIDIDSTTSDIIISKANIDKPFISYSDNKKHLSTNEVKNNTLYCKANRNSHPVREYKHHFLSLRDIIGIAKLVLSKIHIQSLYLFLKIQNSLQSKQILAQEIWMSVSFHLIPQRSNFWPGN